MTAVAPTYETVIDKWHSEFAQAKYLRVGDVFARNTFVPDFDDPEFANDSDWVVITGVNPVTHYGYSEDSTPRVDFSLRSLVTQSLYRIRFSGDEVVARYVP